MVSRSDIKDIVIFKYLHDEMIAKLLPEMELLRFAEGEMIFRSGETADMFYSLKRGKILLEQRVLEKVTISVGSVKPGYSFGWSALLGDQKFTVDTVCGEPCEVLSIRAATLFEPEVYGASADEAVYSVDGIYTLASKQIDLQGVVSPFFLVNSIGSFLTRKGEGLIGFNFNIGGTSDAPQVSVNPLSALTPGMFREIFRRPAPDISE